MVRRALRRPRRDVARSPEGDGCGRHVPRKSSPLASSPVGVLTAHFSDAAAGASSFCTTTEDDLRSGIVSAGPWRGTALFTSLFHCGQHHGHTGSL